MRFTILLSFAGGVIAAACGYTYFNPDTLAICCLINALFVVFGVALDYISR